MINASKSIQVQEYLKNTGATLTIERYSISAQVKGLLVRLIQLGGLLTVVYLFLLIAFSAIH